MSDKFKNTKTQKRLMQAFAGESMARNRYTFYADIARHEGYEQISGIFLETAENERAHAKRFFQFFGKKDIPVEIPLTFYPVGISNTEDNLIYAAEGEHEENSILYPESEEIAREEGFDDVADCFKEVIEVEMVHEARYRDLFNNLKEDKVFKRDTEVIWKCRNCGYHHFGKEAPSVCPSCLHPRGYFELYCKNF